MELPDFLTNDGKVGDGKFDAFKRQFELLDRFDEAFRQRDLPDGLRFGWLERFGNRESSP